MIIFEKITKSKRYEIKNDKYIQSIVIQKWLKQDEDSYILEKWIHIPYTPHSFYIHFIYPHLGICHKDLRSKWYIGKAKEKK